MQLMKKMDLRVAMYRLKPVQLKLLSFCAGDCWKSKKIKFKKKATTLQEYLDLVGVKGSPPLS